MMKKLIILSLLLIHIAVNAQIAESVPVPSAKIKLFFECQDCKESYFINQMTFVDFVRDTQNSDVHLYVTKQKNASEGFRYFLNFVGKGQFSDIKFKLQTDSPESESSLKRNNRILKTAKMGLAPFVSRTKVANKIDFVCNDSLKTIDKELDDPWDYWVFVMDLGGELDAESSVYEYVVSGRLNCKRITDIWKHRFVFDYDYENETYDYQTNNTKQSIKKAFTFHTRSVYALTSHWSAQYSAAIKQDTYYNYDFYWDFGPGLEYNFFTWDKSDRKVFTARYELKARYFDYIQPTVNNLQSDLLWNHFLGLELILRQPWGDIESECKYSTYLDNWEMYKLSLQTKLSVKLARGFSVFLNVEGALINDQHYLPMATSTLEDRLLQARKEETPFELAGEVGIRFSFGSIYNSVVNHRF